VAVVCESVVNEASLVPVKKVARVEEGDGRAIDFTCRVGKNGQQGKATASRPLWIRSGALKLCEH
jgi:hypothetical protein